MVEAYSLVLFQASPAHGQRVTTASGDGKVFYEAAVKAVLEDRDLQRVGPQECCIAYTPLW